MRESDTVLAVIQAAGYRGRFFAVDFVKRTDGADRHMVARLGVHRGTLGVGMAYDPAEHDLLTVFDIHAPGKGPKRGDFRSVPLDRVVAVNGRAV